MSTSPLEQALFVRPDRQPPRLVARSAGFQDAWLAEADALILGFGDRPVESFRCPPTVFAKPLTATHIAIVRVCDEASTSLPTAFRFHFLIVEKQAYEHWIRDPFMLAEKFTPTWDATDSLPTLTIPENSFQARTLAQVQGVLKRVKASALREGEDPESPDFERTPENSESPALLGGAQVLVDDGRLVFERPNGDLALVSGLWLLLPEATRARLWPTSFAFSADLEFDVLVLPHVDEAGLEGYTTEEQAAHYPEGTYESSLQRAAEQGTQAELDYVFQKRDSRSVIRLALLLLIAVSALVLMSRLLDLLPTGPPPDHHHKVAAAAGIVAVGEPWTALGMIAQGNALWQPAEKKRDGK
jgi:hypothetical protein